VPNIAIVWDFDGTLTPHDSTTQVVESFLGSGKGKEFWDTIHKLRGDQERTTWEHVLAMDAPIWMYALSRLAKARRVPLNREYFQQFILPYVETYAHVALALERLKGITQHPEFSALGLEIHHFIVTAGLKDLVEQVLPKELITWTFGCRYTVLETKDEQGIAPVSVPVFCMDETMKTRSLFEITKGVFADSKRDVNKHVPKSKLWAPFENMIYSS
jgi:FMN phosphatase YigB (HAD superfamily)